MHPVLSYFHQIAKIPRPSKKEEKIRQRLIDRAEKKGYRYKIDKIKNICISIPSKQRDSNSHKTAPIILQSHMDMVCVAKPWKEIDFEKDSISVYEQDGRLHGDETTLWADNGIGMAMMLALADEKDHPALELLFTVDEETGLTGALNIDPELCTGRYLINLDTEDDRDICISSAGGGRIDVRRNISDKKTERNDQKNISLEKYKVSLSGYRGGHSWIDIDKGRRNAILDFATLIDEYTWKIQVHSCSWWDAGNAIATSISAVISVSDREKRNKHVREKWGKRKKDESDISRYIKEQGGQGSLSDYSSLFKAIAQGKNGVIAMSKKIEWLVQTSINCWMISCDAEGAVVTFAPRSSDKEQMQALIEDMKSHYEAIGFVVEISDIYPWREQSPEDLLVQQTKACYERVVWETCPIVAYHAWLECGALVERLTSVKQAVSIGPTIKDPHTIKERVDIESVERVYEVVKWVCLLMNEHLL